MSCSIVINQSAQKLQVNKDSYDLGRISNVQVRVLSWKDKILNMIMLGPLLPVYCSYSCQRMHKVRLLHGFFLLSHS